MELLWLSSDLISWMADHGQWSYYVVSDLESGPVGIEPVLSRAFGVCLPFLRTCENRRIPYISKDKIISSSHENRSRTAHKLAVMIRLDAAAVATGHWGKHRGVIIAGFQLAALHLDCASTLSGRVKMSIWPCWKTDHFSKNVNVTTTRIIRGTCRWNRNVKRFT